MVRTQVQFTLKEGRRLQAIALRQGISVSELIRRLVNLALHDESRKSAARYERAARLVGAFPDRRNARDLSRRHDDHIQELLDPHVTKAGFTAVS